MTLKNSCSAHVKNYEPKDRMSLLKFVNGAQKSYLRCADSLPAIGFSAVYLPFLKNQWKIGVRPGLTHQTSVGL